MCLLQQLMPCALLPTVPPEPMLFVVCLNAVQLIAWAQACNIWHCQGSAVLVTAWLFGTVRVRIVASCILPLVSAVIALDVACAALLWS
jgi:hypothetical protein